MYSKSHALIVNSHTTSIDSCCRTLVLHPTYRFCQNSTISHIRILSKQLTTFAYPLKQISHHIEGNSNQHKPLFSLLSFTDLSSCLQCFNALHEQCDTTRFLFHTLEDQPIQNGNKYIVRQYNVNNVQLILES